MAGSEEESGCRKESKLDEATCKVSARMSLVVCIYCPLFVDVHSLRMKQ